MPTIAIVGAGPGLGVSIARTFGARNFSIALISRTQANLDELAAELTESGIDAEGFEADVTDPWSIEDAFARIKHRFGGVDVLEYSPSSEAVSLVNVADLEAQQVQPTLDFQLFGAITATRQVLPDMLVRGSGSLLYTTGMSSVHPMPAMGNYGIAGAAVRNYALALHQQLAGSGVFSAHLAIGVYMARGAEPGRDPDRIAEALWHQHAIQRDAEIIWSEDSAED